MKTLTIEQLIKRAKKDLVLALKMIKNMENLEKLEGVEETPVEENLETPSEEISEGEEVASEEASEEIEETPSV